MESGSGGPSELRAQIPWYYVVLSEPAEFCALAPRTVTADVQRQREMRVAAVSEGRSGQHLPYGGPPPSLACNLPLRG